MPSINDKKQFRDVEQALKSMGVAAAEAETLWKVVAAVLHLVCISTDYLSKYSCYHGDSCVLVTRNILDR